MDFSSEALEHLIKTYYQHKAVDSGIDYVINREDNNLRHQDLELSIMERKRKLGLPVSSSEYQDATNSGESFFSRLSPLATNRGLKAIPNASFLKPQPSPFFKVAHAVEDLLPSIGLSTKYGAAKNGSITSFLRRAASL